jgi:hypothetical protein
VGRFQVQYTATATGADYQVRVSVRLGKSLELISGATFDVTVYAAAGPAAAAQSVLLDANGRVARSSSSSCSSSSATEQCFRHIIVILLLLGLLVLLTNWHQWRSTSDIHPHGIVIHRSLETRAMS